MSPTPLILVAGKAEAMTGQWTLLYDEITAWRIAHNEVAAGREGEGEDGSEASARADELKNVLDLMDHMEADGDPAQPRYGDPGPDPEGHEDCRLNPCQYCATDDDETATAAATRGGPVSATTREEWLKSFGVSGWVHADETVCDEYLAPPASAPPAGYWCTAHQMFVRHPASPIILEVSKYDPDEDPQVIAASYQAELIPSSLPHRDRAFLIADEDVDFADEWDDEDSNAYQDRAEAGLEPEGSDG